MSRPPARNKEYGGHPRAPGEGGSAPSALPINFNPSYKA